MTRGGETGKLAILARDDNSSIKMKTDRIPYLFSVSFLLIEQRTPVRCEADDDVLSVPVNVSGRAKSLHLTHNVSIFLESLRSPSSKLGQARQLLRAWREQ